MHHRLYGLSCKAFSLNTHRSSEASREHDWYSMTSGHVAIHGRRPEIPIDITRVARHGGSVGDDDLDGPPEAESFTHLNVDSSDIADIADRRVEPSGPAVIIPMLSTELN